MWCEILEIGGVTSKVCERWSHDKETTCGICNGTARVPYPDPVPVCGCGNPGNHPVLCSYRRSFFENERQPTEREVAYVQASLAGTSKTKAAALVGATPSALDTPATRKYMAHALEEAGITDLVLAEKIRSGMQARMSIKLRGEDGAPWTTTPASPPREGWRRKVSFRLTVT